MKILIAGWNAILKGKSIAHLNYGSADITCELPEFYGFDEKRFLEGVME